MNNSIYRTINLEYQKKKDRALSEVQERKRDLLEQYPELQEIEDELRRTGLSLTKLILQDNAGKTDIYLEGLNQKLSELKKKKEQLLKDMKILPDVFEPKFECINCKDTGYVDDGNGQMCSCYRQKLINLAYKQSNLELISTENFQTLRIDVYSQEIDADKFGFKISPRENIIRIKEKSLEFINKIDEPKEKNLLFTGEPGLGKTFLTNCIAKELLNKGKTVIYQTAPRLLDIIMNYKMRYQKQDDFADGEYNNLFEVDLLIVDDLGTEMLNSARFSELFTIINTRLLTQQSKCTKTILSSNLSLEKMNEFYDDRLMSRLLGDFYICKFFGDDIRLKKGRWG